MSLSHRGSAPRMRQGRDAGEHNAAGQKRLPTGDYGQGAALDRAFIGRPAPPGFVAHHAWRSGSGLWGGPHCIGRAETINTVRARCALMVRAPFHPPRIDEGGPADPPRCSFSTQGVGISRSLSTRLVADRHASEQRPKRDEGRSAASSDGAGAHASAPDRPPFTAGRAPRRCERRPRIPSAAGCEHASCGRRRFRH